MENEETSVWAWQNSNGTICKDEVYSSKIRAQSAMMNMNGKPVKLELTSSPAVRERIGKRWVMDRLFGRKL